jgi:CubicO group peptidase (beta-lactamase class C family)
MRLSSGQGISLVTFPVFGFLLACAPEDPTRLEMLTSPEAIAELEARLPVLMDRGGVTGLAMAVTSDTGLFWARGFGVRSAETGDPVTENSVFEAASLSKPVFAYAVLQLVDQGLIELDTPISEYYGYPDIAHDERHTLITPRMVLTHTPGFPNWRPRGEGLTIDREPGTAFRYSGEGFVYLQRAVMALTGESLDSLARRLVFEPLGMTSSSYLWQERFEETVALPHGTDGEVLEKNKPRLGRGNAAASFHTTAPDFARFMTAVMNGTGLRDSTALAMLTPQIQVDSGLSWGLGIGLQDTEEGRAFWHWGDNRAYKAYAIAYPEEGVGIVWFTNSENGHGILGAMLEGTLGGAHPAVAWLDYEAYDSPVRLVRVALEDAYETSGIESALARYHELKVTEPPEAFDEFLLNGLGYRLLRAGRIHDAIAVFELNVAEYPGASNPYDGLGEAYLAAGDTARAIAAYERSVELDPENLNGLAVLGRIRS